MISGWVHTHIVSCIQSLYFGYSVVKLFMPINSWIYNFWMLAPIVATAILLVFFTSWHHYLRIKVLLAPKICKHDCVLFLDHQVVEALVVSVNPSSIPFVVVLAKPLYKVSPHISFMVKTELCHETNAWKKVINSKCKKVSLSKKSTKIFWNANGPLVKWQWVV